MLSVTWVCFKKTCQCGAISNLHWITFPLLCFTEKTIKQLLKDECRCDYVKGFARYKLKLKSKEAFAEYLFKTEQPEKVCADREMPESIVEIFR